MGGKGRWEVSDPVARGPETEEWSPTTLVIPRTRRLWERESKPWRRTWWAALEKAVRRYGWGLRREKRVKGGSEI